MFKNYYWKLIDFFGEVQNLFNLINKGTRSIVSFRVENCKLSHLIFVHLSDNRFEASYRSVFFENDRLDARRRPQRIIPDNV